MRKAFMLLRRCHRLPLVVAFVAVVLVSAPADTFAQSPRRARMSSDLVDRLAKRIEASTTIIVSASDAGVDQLVTRYGARLKKRLAGGAVLEATGGQLDAISQDPEVAHIASDAKVFRQMAVTTEATGADQVWNGLAGLRGLTGKGIGVAVIDSGVSTQHTALKNRVVAALDFTASGNVGDNYGHGTHVAGIIGETGKDGFTGMAPGTWLVSLKALGADGSGNTSDVIEAFEWGVVNRARFNIREMNLSLGHAVLGLYLCDPPSQAAQGGADA